MNAAGDSKGHTDRPAGAEWSAKGRLYLVSHDPSRSTHNWACSKGNGYPITPNPEPEQMS